MAAVKRGNKEAFSALFNRYKVPIMTFIYGYVRSSERAEDLFQETFIRLWKHRRRYNEKKALKPWLYTIAANLCRDHARKMRYRTASSLDHAREGIRPKDVLPASSPSPAREAQDREDALRLHAALQSLPEENRTALMLHQFHGLKYREIAETLRVPIGTVKSRIHAAVRQLRTILAPQEDTRQH